MDAHRTVGKWDSIPFFFAFLLLIPLIVVAGDKPGPGGGEVVEGKTLDEWRTRFKQEDTDNLAQINQEIKDDQAQLARLNKNPNDSGFQRLDPSRPAMSQMMQSSKSQQLPAKQQLQAELKLDRDAVAQLQTELQKLPTESEKELDGRIHAATDHDKQVAALQQRYANPQTAGDYVARELLGNGSVSAADFVEVESEGTLSKKAVYGMAGALYAGKDSDKTVPYAHVKYKFVFTTEAGLQRQNVGQISVAQIDGIWRPVSYNIDGVTDDPYPDALHKFVTDLQTEQAGSKN